MENTNKNVSLPFFGIPRIAPYLKPFRRLLLTMVVCGLLGSVMDVGLPDGQMRWITLLPAAPWIPCRAISRCLSA